MKLNLLSSLKLPESVDFTETSQLCGDIGDQPNQPTRGAHLFINSKMEFQTMAGMGGAFSELGGKALKSLEDSAQDEIAQNLFKDKFNYFRLPVGSSDFGIDAYSLNDTPDDFDMNHFTLSRDAQYVIPYMDLAKKYCDDMKIHASPWSPPAWLKDTKEACKGGSLVDSPEYYTAYAKYFIKLVEEYAKLGFNIARINVQNEPDVDPIYPSCIMPMEQMAKFIKGYMHPMFKEANIDTEIFAGTFRGINGAHVCDFMTCDTDLDKYIDGIGCQYTTMQPLYELMQKYPNLKLMHTESNCFHGENSWEQAIVLYMSIINYIKTGCDTFSYWNMILNTVSENSWGWKQNSLITINEDTKEVVYNPDYHVITLACTCIKPNAKRIIFTSMNKMGIAFKNEDGSINFMVSNFSNKQEVGYISIDGVKLDITLEPMSIVSYSVTED